jgi:uncharacterized protein (TIGR03435 family)
MTRKLLALGPIVLSAAVIFCQSAKTPPAFVIADVHPSSQGTNAPIQNLKGPFIAGDRFELRNATLLDMIRLAYSPATNFMIDADNVVGGPSWLNFTQYDVTARTAANSSYENIKMMLRTLLADRFKLVIRNDSAPRPAYALTASGKPALKEASDTGGGECKKQGGDTGPGFGAPVSYSCRSISMAAFAEAMGPIGFGSFSNARIVDQTGIKGVWDFDFKFTPIRPTGTEGVSFVEAVQQQLGLNITPTKVPTPILVVTGANEKPTPNPPGVAKELPPLPPEFEVADIKLTAPNSTGIPFQVQPGGRLQIHGATLRSLIVRAWGIRPADANDAVIGPKFIDSTRFDITAQAPIFGLPPGLPPAAASDGFLSRPLRFTDLDSMAPMLRSLLVQRFGLTFHNEERPLSAFKLTAAKPKLQKADPSHRTGCRMEASSTAPPPRPVRFVCENITMAQFAAALPMYDTASVMSRAEGPITNVLDATALQGAWDFTLNFTPESRSGANPFAPTPRPDLSSDPAKPGVGGPAPDPGSATFFEAMQKQLGLKLEKTRRPGPVMIIDHLEERPKELGR